MKTKTKRTIETWIYLIIIAYFGINSYLQYKNHGFMWLIIYAVLACIFLRILVARRKKLKDKISMEEVDISNDKFNKERVERGKNILNEVISKYGQPDNYVANGYGDYVIIVFGAARRICMCNYGSIQYYDYDFSDIIGCHYDNTETV